MEAKSRLNLQEDYKNLCDKSSPAESQEQKQSFNLARINMKKKTEVFPPDYQQEQKSN